MVSESTTAPPKQQGACSALYGALARAQSLCRKAEFDGRYEGGKVKYSYTSANERLAVARDALSQCGLALVRAGLPKILQQTVERELVDANGEVKPDNSAFWLLEQDFLLTHESGESHATGFRWPVPAAETFRPFDRSVAVAHTLGLSYMLRDLLLMPSAESEDEAELSPGASVIQMPSRPAPPAAAAPAPSMPAKQSTPQAGSPAPAAAAPVLPAPSVQAATTVAAPSAAQPALKIPADEFDKQIAANGLAAHVAQEERAKSKLTSAPLTAAKLFAMYGETQDKALYLEVFAVAEKRFGSRDRAIAAVKELGVATGIVPTVAQLRKFVEVMP